MFGFGKSKKTNVIAEAARNQRGEAYWEKDGTNGAVAAPAGSLQEDIRAMADKKGISVKELYVEELPSHLTGDPVNRAEKVVNIQMVRPEERRIPSEYMERPITFTAEEDRPREQRPLFQPEIGFEDHKDEAFERAAFDPDSRIGHFSTPEEIERYMNGSNHLVNRGGDMGMDKYRNIKFSEWHEHENGQSTEVSRENIRPIASEGMNDMNIKQVNNSTVEATVISKGVKINGSIISPDGAPITVYGTVAGDVKTAGSLRVEGSVLGNLQGKDVLIANDARVNGMCESQSSVVVEENGVLIGNIVGTQVNIAGSVKGDIDSQDSIILQPSAVLLGDMKSKSVSIASEATFEGRCTQTYSNKDASTHFEAYEKEMEKDFSDIPGAVPTWVKKGLSKNVETGDPSEFKSWS